MLWNGWKQKHFKQILQFWPMLGGYQFYFLNDSQYASSQNFENNQFSFASSHKPGITY